MAIRWIQGAKMKGNEEKWLQFDEERGVVELQKGGGMNEAFLQPNFFLVVPYECFPWNSVVTVLLSACVEPATAVKPAAVWRQSWRRWQGERENCGFRGKRIPAFWARQTGQPASQLIPLF